MPADRKIDYVEFPATDLDAIEAFYSRVFGWTFEDYGEGYRAFSDGRLDGGFYKSDARSNTATGAALVVLYADDLEGVQRAVVEGGGFVVRETFEFPGGRRFHFADPHGNELAVWSSS